jgi:putative peptidoglycan lipid II flippase
LFSYSAVKIMVPTFYALNDTRTPLRLSMITVAVKIVLNLLMTKPFGFLGLALSTVVASWLNYGLLWRHLRRTCSISSTGTDRTAYLRIALASIAMGCIAWLLFHGCTFIIPGNCTFFLGLQLGVAMLGAMASLLPLFRLFRVEESSEILRMIGAVIGKFR